MPAKIVNAQQMRAAEEKAAALGVPPSVLMDNAGRAIAEVVAEVARQAAGRPVLVLVGPGNNGGDGLVTARYLLEWGLPVACYVWHRRPEGDRVRELAAAAGVPLFTAEEDGDHSLLRAEVRRARIVVDALLGTGLSRPLSPQLRSLLTAVREERQGRSVVAVDLPSGLNSDSGEVDEATLPADLTVTLGHVKAGLVVSPGVRYAGRVVRVGIGLPPGADVDGLADLLDDPTVGLLLPERPPYGHKGTFGKALVVAGSANYVGAAALACQAAYRVGAGLVTLAIPRGLHAVAAAKLTETTFLPLGAEKAEACAPEALADLLSVLDDYDALLVGPGLGRRPATAAFVQALVGELAKRSQAGSRLPFLALDADALNCLAGSGEWWRGLGSRAVITPHPGEMARLLATTVADVEAKRLEVARRAAQAWGLVAILKGAYSVIASPDGHLQVSPIAVASLATAGSGDVLAGALVGLGAQGLPAAAAATAAVYLHGRAGELAAAQIGAAGAVAGDLIPLLPVVWKSLRPPLTLGRHGEDAER